MGELLDRLMNPIGQRDGQGHQTRAPRGQLTAPRIGPVPEALGDLADALSRALGDAALLVEGVGKRDLQKWSFERGAERVEVAVDGWLLGDNRPALEAPVFAGQLVARFNDLSVTAALRAGLLQPVLLDWEGQNSPPLNLLMRKGLARQPRVRAFVDFMASQVEAMTQQRLPAGMPAVKIARRPDWFKRRVG